MSAQPEEVQKLRQALREVVDGAVKTKDPVLAASVGILYKSRTMEVISVEALNTEYGTLNALSIALLGALVKQELDPRIREPLEQAFRHASAAQRARLSPPSGKPN